MQLFVPDALRLKLKPGLGLMLAGLLLGASASLAQAHEGKTHVDAQQANIDHRHSNEPAFEDQPDRIDFSLTTDLGSWQLSSLRGKVVLVVFGYTSCADVCPTSLQILAEAFDQLEPELQEQARGVFVSLDPERDDNAKLRQYASFFHPNIIGVTGTQQQVKALADELGVRFKINNPGQENYSVDHSTLAFAIDPQGYKLMVLVSHAAPPSFVAQLIRDTLQPVADPVVSAEQLKADS